MSFSIESKIRDILADDQAKAAVEKILPGFSKHPQLGLAKSMSLKTVAKYSGGLITDEALQKIDAEFQAIG